MTIAINSCISVKLVMRETGRAEAGCAGCRLGARDHQGCNMVRSERANFDRIVKMKTVRMTAITAFCFVVCQVFIFIIVDPLNLIWTFGSIFSLIFAETPILAIVG